MLFRPRAFPIRVSGAWGSDGTNVAMDLVLGTAMLIAYAGTCQNGIIMLAKWQIVIEKQRRGAKGSPSVVSLFKLSVLDNFDKLSINGSNS